MNVATNYAEVFDTESQSGTENLRKTIDDFPVSSIARFLLLHHHKKNKLPDFEKLSKESAIYFDNLPWIQFQLDQLEKKEENEINNFSDPDQKNLLADESISTVHQEKDLTPNEILSEDPEETESENENASDSQITSDIILPTPVNEEISTNLILANQPNHEKTEEIAHLEEQSHAHLITPIEEQSKESFVEKNEETSGSDEPVFESTISEEEKPDTNEEILIPDNHNEDEESTLSFEPLHTVDYFASLGIKINEEALANDHLGRQVKSFTAWLKSMKKLHPGQLPEQNEVIEKIIQSASEASNQNANVLTEAMAEVLVKQDKREKAIDMYEKLSLLNPSKSAYFAAKIKSLKII